jgi:hypothetical protein
MKKPMIMIEGFAGLRESEPFITASQNKKNTQVVIDDWMLGPEKPSNERGANPEYWRALGKAMQVDEAEARRRRCGNCEYFINSTLMQAKMDKIPWNQWDVGAGFRGYCEKFDFICHDMRSCQAWEEREFESED